MFYRVEHPTTARGPYNPSLEGLSGATPGNRPMPHEDGIGEWYMEQAAASDAGMDYVFGFESLRQLYEWFRDDLKRLQDHGYVVHRYAATGEGGVCYRRGIKVHRGRCQLIFARYPSEFDEAEVVEWQDVWDWNNRR